MDSIRRTMVGDYLVLLDKVSVVSPIAEIGCGTYRSRDFYFYLIVEGHKLKVRANISQFEKLRDARKGLMTELGWDDSEEGESTEDGVCL